MIKALPTIYKNHTFRSRMEARWALFFDLIGVKWIYEPDVYDLGDGEKYFPDFYFPEYDFFAEVKPTDFNELEEKKWLKFCKINNKRLLLLVGNPHAKVSKLYNPCLKDQFYDEDFDFDYSEVIPFAYLVKGSYGLFWYAGGDEDWAQDYCVFQEPVLKANSQKYYVLK